MKSPSQTELAWAAGFFDGEGSFVYYGNSTLRLSIGQNNSPKYGPALLERFNSALWNLGTIYKQKRQGDYSQIYFHGAKAIQAFAMLYTYLGPVKREQGATAIEKWKNNRRGWQLCLHNGHQIRTWGGKKTCKTCWDAKWKNRKK